VRTAPTLAELILLAGGSAVKGLYHVTPSGVLLTGSAIDSILDQSGGGLHAVATSTERATYAATGISGKPSANFAGGQQHIAPALDLAAFRSLAVVMLLADANNTTAVPMQRSTGALTSSPGGMQFATNNGGAWVNTFTGYKGGYAYVPNPQLEAYDLTSPSVVTGLWDQERTIWETDLRINVAEVSLNSGRIDTDTTGGFGSHPILIGASNGLATPWTGSFGCLVLLCWAGALDVAAVDTMLNVETLIKAHYA
jgi:hypothetical protein